MGEFVSVVVPMKNAAPYVEECLRSILSEKIATLEIVVVDDQSSDGSRGLVSSIRDSRIRIIEGPGVGISASLNAGLRSARGSIIMRCDADDSYPRDRIKHQVDWLNNHPEFDAVCGSFTAIDSRGRTLLQMECAGDQPLDLTDTLLSGVTKTHLCTFAIRSTLVQKVGEFRPFFKTAEDIDYQLRLSEAGRVAYFPTSWYNYRIHSDSITHTQADEQRIYFENVARSLQMQRRLGHQDRLARGLDLTPQEFSSKPAAANEHIQGLLLGRAWQEHSKGSKAKAIALGFKAIIAQPLSGLAWKSVASLILK
jgi:glycosyltransferase involved in cell wall biosynthesis